MTNEQNELNCVNWGQIFGFTRIFKSFRLAMNMSSLTLGLAVIAMVWATGSIMGTLASFAGQNVMTGEIQNFGRQKGTTFLNIKEEWEKARPGNVATLTVKARKQRHSLGDFSSNLYNREIKNQHFYRAFKDLVSERNTAAEKDEPYKAPKYDALRTEAEKGWSNALGLAKEDIAALTKRIERVIEDARKRADAEVKKLPDDKQGQAKDDLDKYYVKSLKALTTTKMTFQKAEEKIRGREIFESFVDFEAATLKDAAMALLSGRITGGLKEYVADDNKAPAAANETGFIVLMLTATQGVAWLFCEHSIFATILLLITLAIWALLGGAIHRIVAVQAAREEKISLIQALRFSREKFVSFFLAPLMPLGIIVGLGAFLILGGLLVNIPWGIGPIFVGLIFIVALMLGLAIAFLLIGLIGGAGLMFPTIAVEGSDAFDAMSRSFTYVLSRPWRAALYTTVAIVHGTICYIFIRVFVYLALKATHFFVSGGVWVDADTLPGVADPDKMDLLWTSPTLTSLHSWNWEAMSWAQAVGAAFMMIWIYVLIGLVGAFVLTYVSSAATSIYLLLRRKVDATDYDEVYVEEEDETDFAAVVQPADPAEPAKADEAPTKEEPAVDEPAEEKPVEIDDNEKADEADKDTTKED